MNKKIPSLDNFQITFYLSGDKTGIKEEVKKIADILNTDIKKFKIKKEKWNIKNFRNSFNSLNFLNNI